MIDEEEHRVLWIGVDGHPRSLPRARHVRGRRRPVAIMDRKAKLWAGLVEREAGRALDTVPENERGWLSGPLEMRIDFNMPTDKQDRWGCLHTSKPDKDNLEKMVADCLERAGVLPGGDQVIASGETRKLWARQGGCVISLRGVNKRQAGASETGAGDAKAPDWLG